MNQQTIVFLGPQGSGKGTQLQLLKEFFEKSDPTRTVLHFEMGATFRGFSGEEGYSQGLVKATLAQGQIQPDFLATALFGRTMLEHFKGSEHLLMDGYPRTRLQAQDFNSALSFYNLPAPLVLHLNLDEAAALERLHTRAREDDTEEALKQRLAWYQAQVVPTLDYFRANPLYTVREVNSAQSIEQVHADIVNIITAQ